MTLPRGFVAELRKRFSGDIRLDMPDRILYSTDASIYRIQPLGVLLPRHRDDVQAAVEGAAKYGISIVPRGAGTSLAGQAIGEGLILDCSRWLDNILEIDADRRIARVEPGVILSRLNRQAAQVGLQFGPDPASGDRATMGGVVANNASGAHSILYGVSADHLVSANVVLSDGSLATFGPIRDAGRQEGSSRYDSIRAVATDIRANHGTAIRRDSPRTWRNSAGYRLNYLLPWSPSQPPAWHAGTYPPVPEGADFNLAHVLAGSEGTLAVFRDLTVGLVTRPKHTALGILSYEDVGEACDAVPRLLERNPSAIELVPRVILQAARDVPGYASQMGWLQGDPAALLLVEFSGEDPRQIEDRVKALGDGAQVLLDQQQQSMVWSTRKAGLGLLDSKPQSARPVSFIEDCAIPVEHLGSFVRDIQRLLEQHGTSGGIYGHASAGCLHIRPLLDLKQERGLRSLRDIAEQTMALALRHGGSMSSEHGDGISRGEWLRGTYGEEVAGAMVMLKRAADPMGILNPRKMFDAPPMDSQLRYGVEYRSTTWESTMEFKNSGGLAGAIEQCNGQGVCRKDGGVMCPSFQATRDEMYSTRGRANLLRALISFGMPSTAARSQPSTQRALDKAVSQALDLCLACKGCKAECPSGVDMAMLKSAHLEHSFRGRMRPLRDYLFGYFAQTARILNMVGPAVNLAFGVPPVRGLVSRALGITARRPLPRFRAAHRSRPQAASDRVVLFLRDPFTHYVDVAVEEAAFMLLAAAGFRVHVLDIMGSGASLISRGFLKPARRYAETLTSELERIDPGGNLPLVLIEPSEWVALSEDLGRLAPRLPQQALTRLSGAQSVERLLVSSGWLPAVSPAHESPTVLFHPHCHEKASTLDSSAPSAGRFAGMELLQACGYRVELVDAGCCGMAGMFGYEEEHFDLSQAIGSLRLFPAIKASPDSWIAATGGSCRLHISQGTGRNVHHPLVLAARHVERSRS